MFFCLLQALFNFFLTGVLKPGASLGKTRRWRYTEIPEVRGGLIFGGGSAYFVFWNWGQTLEEQSIKVTAISENWGRPEQTIEFAVIRISKTRRIFSFNSAYIFYRNAGGGEGDRLRRSPPPPTQKLKIIRKDMG